MRSFPIAAVLGLLAAGPAQSLPSRPSDDDALLAKILGACERLRADGKLVPTKQLRGEHKRTERALSLAAPHTERLDPEALCALARKSLLIVGSYYLCGSCSEWHFDAASGFALTADGAVATCWHLVEDVPEQQQSCVVVAALDGSVWPVRTLLAADPEADVCVLGIDAKGLVPMPLVPDVRQGQRVYCLSNPDEHFAFFGEGLVARWALPRAEPEKPGQPAPPRRPLLEVTLDFAAGSSGAPIFDARGNVVGLAQATQTILHGDETDPASVQLVIKYAVPAVALRDLVLR